METDGIKFENNNSKNKPSEAERVLNSMPPFEEFRQKTEKPDIKMVYYDGNSKEDAQIRAGLLTHIQVEPGDTLDSITEKLEYMKSQGKNAFANFNGQRIDNWSEIDSSGDIERVGGENIEKKSDEVWAENMKTFEALDDSFDIPNEGKYGLVGVIGGVKQATEFLIYAKDGEEAQKSNDTETLLNGLGLKYAKDVERSEYDPNYIEIQYYVAETENMVQRVRGLIEASRKEGQTGEATRELGRLFGFPATAIDYFVRRNKGEVSDNDNMSSKKYGFYIHSPENGETEYMQYEQKINELFKKYCPMSAQEFLNT